MKDRSRVAPAALLVGCTPGATPPATVCPDPPEPEPEVTMEEPEPAPIADDGSDRVPPRIESATLVAHDRLSLRFTEPVGRIDGVNPRQFRVSFAYTMSDPQGYAYAAYADPGLEFGGDEGEDPLIFTAIQHGKDDAVLDLVLNREIPVETCAEINQTKADLEAERAEAEKDPELLAELESTQVGLYLHYTGRGSEGIRDRAGNRLEDMGAQWALHFGAQAMNTEGKPPVARMDLLVEITCFKTEVDY